MSDKHVGSCLCGAVRFEIEGEFEAFFLCHCSRCRKGTGSAHAANLFSSSAKLTWLAGGENVRSYKVSSSRHQRSFCAACGSALPRVQVIGLVAPAGAFDSDIAIRPNAHICVASAASWDRDLEDVPKLDGLPG
ncbi:MAG TPA: GFA family protein [Candidatus Binatia bacterium]|nr:GFA family protein [Candidatus Binatia bacterium]